MYCCRVRGDVRQAIFDEYGVRVFVLIFYQCSARLDLALFAKYQADGGCSSAYGGHGETVITAVCGTAVMGSTPIGRPIK